MDRRSFVRASFAAAAGIPALQAACTRTQARTGSGSLDRIGLQLYTVRQLMAESVERTLEMVAEIGYHEVEFAGYFERSPPELRATLDGLGLSAPATHYGLNIFREGLDQAIETGATLGHRYLVLPSLPAADHDELDDYRRIGAEMNGFGEACQAAGMEFAYHNHAFEFEAMDGRIPFDVLLEETDPELVHIELDLFWAIEGGQDPLAYFEAHPGRFHLCHVKDRLADGTMVAVGSGELDFAAMFAQADRAGLRHFFVEHDQPSDPGASVRNSYRHLSQLTW